MLRITMKNGKSFESKKTVEEFKSELYDCEHGYSKLIRFDDWEKPNLWVDPSVIASVEVVEKSEQ